MSYHLLLKTGDAELRAWRNLGGGRQRHVSVHCEITRGRKRPNKDKSVPFEYNITSIFRAITEDFKNCNVCVVDLTREEQLTSSETKALGASDNGYLSWVTKISELHRANSKVRPTLLINPSENEDFDTFQRNLIAQFDQFTAYDLISYRVSVLHDGEFLEDLRLLCDRINAYIAGGNRFEILLDFEYIQPSTAALHAAYATPIIREIRELLPDVSIVSVGTSFPKSVTDLGGDDRDEFRLEEVSLNEEINRSQNRKVEYGDYGSINPLRNDVAPPVGAHMRARVDFPTKDNRIFYWRVAPSVDKATNTLMVPRSQMYKTAAKLVVKDSSFESVQDSWGCDKILQAANQSPEGSNPAFWISVRMEIHMCRRVDAMLVGQV